MNSPPLSVSAKTEIVAQTNQAHPTTLPPPLTPSRFVALDLSKRSIVVAAVNDKQQIVLQPRKIGVEKFENWARQQLSSSDVVVLEATGNAWYYYDLLCPLVAEVKVANPILIKLIARTRVKTDARDALALAKLLAAGLIPEVWVPPIEVRELRALVAHRKRLVRQRTQTQNRIHALLHTHHLPMPPGAPFAVKHKAWWDQLELPLTQKLLLSQFMTLLEQLDPLIKQVEQQIVELSTQGRWATQSAFLIQLPGIGVLSAMTILGAIGDITRFPSAKKLVGYSGMGASIYASGEVVKTGGITRQGREELRSTVVEAAWIAVEQEGIWKEQFERLAVRLGRNKAIVAIARKLLVVIWHVLSKQTLDRQAEEGRVVRKILKWGYTLRKTGRQSLGGRAFMWQELDRLKLEVSLSEVKFSGKAFLLQQAAKASSPGIESG